MSYTAVTCPTVRIHPAILARAAAASTVMLEGRFGLGVGSGEASFAEAGYDEVYIQQIGPNQEEFFDFYQREILPEFG